MSKVLITTIGKVQKENKNNRYRTTNYKFDNGKNIQRHSLVMLCINI